MKMFGRFIYALAALILCCMLDRAPLWWDLFAPGRLVGDWCRDLVVSILPADGGMVALLISGKNMLFNFLRSSIGKLFAIYGLLGECLFVLCS